MLLALHVGVGVAALALGPAALLGVRGTALPYRVLVQLVALTALALTVDSDLPPAVRGALGLVALGSAAAAAAGSERALRASYVALVAAVAFVSAPVWAGALVVAAGSAIVHLPSTRRARRGPPGATPHRSSTRLRRATAR